MRTRLLAVGLVTALAVLGLTPTVAVANPAATPVAAPTAAPAAFSVTTGATTRAPAHRLATVLPRRTPRERRVARARATLTQARAILGLQGRTHGRDATLVLTDLRHHLGDLAPGKDRRAARAILARPTDTGTLPGTGEHAYTVPERVPVCDAHICVHYVTSTPDRVPSTADADGVPDYVRQAQAVLAQVWGVEVGTLGYRPPKDDSALAHHGVDGKLDVYLQDLATERTGLYGYCAPDTADRRTAGYCVLENDYAEAPFQRRSAVENLEVTAAHEFFHAVQLSYDSYEGSWLMEGTAAWMEDQVFDDVDDNRQYLAQSPLTDPSLPLDYADYDTRYSPYGGWIFWEFLGEWAGPGRSIDPTIVRGVWDQAVSASSLRALATTLASRHTSLPAAFRAFGTWIRNPRRLFSEGAAYRPAPTAKVFLLGRSRRGTGAWGARLSHLSRDFVRFRPATNLTGAWRLRLRLDMADRSRGSMAQVVTHRRDGTLSVHVVRLDGRGDATTTVGFGRSRVSSVDLDLGNASARPADDHRAAVFSATAVR